MVSHQSHTTSFSSVRPSTKEEWAGYWLERCRHASISQGLPDETFSTCSKKLIHFFESHPVHPKSISADEIKTYMSVVFQNERYIFNDFRNVLSSFFLMLSKNLHPTTVTLYQTIHNFIPSNTTDWVSNLTSYLKLRKYSLRTISSYQGVIRKYLKYLNAPPGSNDLPAIHKYVLRLHNLDNLSPRTINQASAAITCFYRHIVGFEFTLKDLPRMKPDKDLPKVYGQGDIAKLLSSTLNPKHLLVMMLVYGCGLRLEEIRTLHPTDIDFDRNTIRIKGKGAKQREIPIDESFRSFLKRHLSNNQNQTYLFEGASKGKPYSRRTIQKIYENSCQKAKINRKGGIHSLRHSYATHLLEEGVDINKIRALLGHSSVKTTQIYTHVSREEISKIRSPLASVLSRKQ